MPLLPPGVCWICDQSPIQEEYRVIDTHRNARPGGPQVHESVRKYICEPCAREMGGAMGMVPPETHATTSALLAETNREVLELRNELDAERERKVRVIAADEIADVVSATVRDELAKHVPAKPNDLAKAS